MKRENCRICGRWGSDDPADTCTQTRDMDGEWSCKGKLDPPHCEDADGFFLYRTPEEEAEIEAYLDAVITPAKERGEI